MHERDAKDPPKTDETTNAVFVVAVGGWITAHDDDGGGVVVVTPRRLPRRHPTPLVARLGRIPSEDHDAIHLVGSRDEDVFDDDGFHVNNHPRNHQDDDDDEGSGCMHVQDGPDRQHLQESVAVVHPR